MARKNIICLNTDEYMPAEAPSSKPDHKRDVGTPHSAKQTTPTV
jgi:hypothetical protein